MWVILGHLAVLPKKNGQLVPGLELGTLSWHARPQATKPPLPHYIVQHMIMIECFGKKIIIFCITERNNNVLSQLILIYSSIFPENCRLIHLICQITTNLDIILSHFMKSNDSPLKKQALCMLFQCVHDSRDPTSQLVKMLSSLKAFQLTFITANNVYIKIILLFLCFRECTVTST